MTKKEPISFKETDYPFLEDLSQKIEDILKTKSRVIVVVTGKSGCGKSTFGKFVRKKGFKQFSARNIAVIDDGVMTKDFLYGLIRYKVKIPSDKQDDLAPFLKLLPKRKRIVFYINIFPNKRVTYCDILIMLTCDETVRALRLKKRVSHEEKFQSMLKKEPKIGSMKFVYKILGHTK